MCVAQRKLRLLPLPHCRSLLPVSVAPQWRVSKFPIDYFLQFFVTVWTVAGVDCHPIPTCGVRQCRFVTADIVIWPAVAAVDRGYRVLGMDVTGVGAQR